MEQLMRYLTSVPLIFAASGELIAGQRCSQPWCRGHDADGRRIRLCRCRGMESGSGMFAGAIAGAITASIFAFCSGLATNQVATGLALTIFEQGFRSYWSAIGGACH